ncbi:Alanine--tRNA ligase [uncultured Clostridium sp.]|nr:Alanine--tRNA ligase [uncultured Clostridium sp.]
MISANELRQKFLDFFVEKGHTRIPSASVVPDNDPTVLFTTAGMHPLVPYLMGEKHPAGTRLCDVQKCIRTGDIDDVGDDSHLTFFEMLGNWSLGDYFKADSIRWSWEFLTDPKWLGLDPERIAVSVFAGEDGIPRDDEAADIWRQAGVPEERIFYLPRENNWWGPAGQTGPCGPDTEIFYITDKEPCGPDCSPACDCGRYLEIWNNVFMQYLKTADGQYLPMEHKNVDTGMGLERTIGVLCGAKSVYETDLFTDIIARIESLSGKKYGESPEITRAMRIVADHLRSATFILGDDKAVTPSNVDQGYVLRRLIRRAVRFGMQLGMPDDAPQAIAEVIIAQYQDVYDELRRHHDAIIDELGKEVTRFQRTLRQGMREFEKIFKRIKQFLDNLDKFEYVLPNPENIEQATQLAKQIGSNLRPLPEFEMLQNAVARMRKGFELIASASDDLKKARDGIAAIDGQQAFRLYDTFGFPIEMTVELARENGLIVDEDGFKKAFAIHQQKSHAGAEQRFKGGLADHAVETARLHTATHLLLGALRKVLGDDVYQRGSNITAERLRFDFSFGRKVTKEELAQVQQLVNEAIKADVPVVCEEMTVDEAKAQGAMGIFESKYGEKVKVYTIEGYSKEICGGPHANRTGELGEFIIKKEESSSSGVRRIKAILKYDN